MSQTKSPIILDNTDLLMPFSNKKVLVKCPVCEEKRRISYASITRSHSTCCKRCGRINDISGMTFGRRTALYLDKNSPIGQTRWICRCECGSIKSASYDSLVISETCGCLRDQTASKMASLRIGEKNPNWKPDSVNRRYSNEYHEWIKKIYKRDDYTCQVCKKRGGKINVHHLYSYSEYPENRLEVKNGITLCQDCHTEFHIWNGGKQYPCTPQDFCNWKKIRNK